MNKIALPIIIASILLGASPFIANELLLENKTQFEQNMTAISVSERVTENGTRVGIDPGQNLDFGEIETGIRVTKFLNYDSNNQTRLVSIEVRGNISEKVNTTSEQYVSGNTRLGLSFISEDTGYFTGQATLKTLTPRGELGETWLEIRQDFF